MPQPAASNRRLYYRQPMYQRLNLRVAGVRVPIPATLIDISGGGCQLHARTMLKPHTAVEFDLPRDGAPILRIAGKLRKVTYTPNDRTFRYAMEFDSLSEETRDDLLRFIIDEQRRAISGRKRPDEEPPSHRSKAQTRLQELRAHHRVETNFPVRYTVTDSTSTFNATAIDVSTGGLRLITDQILRQEWIVTVRLTLPNEALRALHTFKGGGGSTRPFQEIRVAARPLPGVKEARGRFTQSLVWVDPDPQVTDEIARFVQAMQVSAIKRR